MLSPPTGLSYLGFANTACTTRPGRRSVRRANGSNGFPALAQRLFDLACAGLVLGWSISTIPHDRSARRGRARGRPRHGRPGQAVAVGFVDVDRLDGERRLLPSRHGQLQGPGLRSCDRRRARSRRPTCPGPDGLIDRAGRGAESSDRPSLLPQPRKTRRPPGTRSG